MVLADGAADESPRDAAVNVSQSPSMGHALAALTEHPIHLTRSSANVPAQLVEASIEEPIMAHPRLPMMQFYNRMPEFDKTTNAARMDATRHRRAAQRADQHLRSNTASSGESADDEEVNRGDFGRHSYDEFRPCQPTAVSVSSAPYYEGLFKGDANGDTHQTPLTQHTADYTATRPFDTVSQRESDAKVLGTRLPKSYDEKRSAKIHAIENEHDPEFYARLASNEQDLTARFNPSAAQVRDGQREVKRMRLSESPDGKPSMAFPTTFPPQVPIPGYTNDSAPPFALEHSGASEEDASTLLRATAETLDKDIASVEVRDEVLNYAHHLYAAAVANGGTQGSSDADALHPVLLPLLHSINRMHQTHLPTLLLLSCVYYTIGNIPGSLWYNNNILRINSNYVEAMSNIGTALRTMGYWREAESWWWRALQLLPGYWDAFENLLGVLCIPGTESNHGERISQFSTALQLCEFVESHIIPTRAKMALSEKRVQAGYSADTMEPQSMPPHMPLAQLPRMQNLFFAKGKLKYVIYGHGIESVAQEYQRAIEITLSNPKHGHFSVRDMVVSICVVSVLSFGAVIPGTDALSTAAEIASTLGIDLSNPVHTWIVSQGIYMRLHPSGILGLVRNSGDKVVKTLLRIGGGQLPCILLLPDQIALLRRIIFAQTSGMMPVFFSRMDCGERMDMTLERVAQQTAQISSTILLALAKLFQDAAMSPEFVDEQLTLQGIPPSVTLLLLLYYFSLSLSPSAAIFNNLGILFSSLPVATATVCASGERVQLTGQLLAMHCYVSGLQIDPKHAHLYTNLGSLFKETGRLVEAIKMYEKAVECNPMFDVVLVNLGNTIKDQGRTQDSIPYYRRSIEANSRFPEALGGLVNALLTVCDWGEVYPEGGQPGLMDKVMAIVRHQLRQSHGYGRGAFKMQGPIEYWLDGISKALGGLSSEEQERWRRRLEPFYTGKHKTNEGGFMLRMIEYLMRRTQYRWYSDKYKRGVHLPDESYGRLLVPSCLPIPAIPTVLPFHTFTYPVTAREARLIAHRNAMRTSHGALSQMWLPKHVYPPPPPPSPRINIGYVSSDFNSHPLAHLIQSVFGMHDRSRFNIFCYATSPPDHSTYRHKIEHEAQHFIDVSNWPTQRIINQILRDQIHILVNLNGYTKGARSDIFASRPCPVQIQLMGFAGTMASSWTDWMVADPIVCHPRMTSAFRWRERNCEGENDWIGDFGGSLDPESPREDWVYTERLIYMPRTYFANDHAQGFRHPAEVNFVASEVALSADDAWEIEEMRRWTMRKRLFPSLPDDYVIFADFNQLYKTDPSLFKVWLRILARVPKSVLWLLRFPASGETHLRRFALEWGGPDVASRVIFTDVAPKHVHIYRGRVADLFLDTTECNAHTTAADILWSGTPLLTWPQHTHKMCSRVAASIVLATNEGSKLVAHSAQEYEERAVEFANSISYSYVLRTPEGDKPLPPPAPSNTRMDPVELTSHVTDKAVVESMVPPSTNFVFRRGHGELVDIRLKLFMSRDACPLFDTRAWTQALETGYEEAWRRWESGTEMEDTPEWRALPADAPERRSSHIWLCESN